MLIRCGGSEMPLGGDNYSPCIRRNGIPHNLTQMIPDRGHENSGKFRHVGAVASWIAFDDERVLTNHGLGSWVLRLRRSRREAVAAHDLCHPWHGQAGRRR